MQFDSKPVEEHRDVPVADEGRWEDLVSHWQERELGPRRKSDMQRSYVVSVAINQDEFPPAREREILSLAKAQGDIVVGHELCRLNEPDPRALFRKGTAASIGQHARASGADVLIVDALLSPSQSRNLEDLTGLAVRDREAVILNVFQKHARTRKARIQVEIAHLEYLRPRIRGLGLEMDQQAGGITGSRGPGETASELLARQLDGRLAVLRNAFAQMKNDGEVQRKRRSNCERIALVGYTNAGKTSLMNGLTNAGLSAANQPFETLDTTSRCLTRHGGDVLLSDTVGFIRQLPERLFTSFETTLSEIREASLLAIVVDISDLEYCLHLEQTHSMLEKLDARDIPRLYLFTKIDRCDGPQPNWRLRGLAQGHPYLGVCSHDPESLRTLRETLLRMARKGQVRREFLVPYEATEATGLVYAHCLVLDATPEDSGMKFTVQADARWLTQIARALEGNQQ